MIRNPLRAAAHRLRRGRGAPIPYDMFDAERTAGEARAFHKLERIYHIGQQRAWNGKDLLAELVERHGGVQVHGAERDALRRLFAVILWGEMAAWRISADLADELVPLEARMAATSQAHDEARHFYVMHDYLSALGSIPNDLGPATRRVLEGAVAAPSLVKKLLAMQLMIEPMALTVFQVVRKRRVEPVLSELLVYYERDEARHVALGVLHLPEMIAGLSRREAVDLYLWQIRAYMDQFAMLRELAPDFESLGVSPRAVLDVGRQKQMLALSMMMDEFGTRLPVVEWFRRIIDFRAEIDFPEEQAATDRVTRVRRAVRAAMRPTEVTGELSEVAEA